MREELLNGVRSVVEPLLTQLGFQLDEYGDVDVHGRKASVVYFRSNDCKIQVYDASREGEINCMIAPLDAANVIGLYDRSGEWQYLPRFAIRQSVSLDEIMRDSRTVDFPTTHQWLESVRDRIQKYFPVARDGVLEMGGPNI
ncbi:hypothetical protein MLM_3196A [Mycobacterium lepraemurium]|nr:hypothetical protein MLM_3196A [Mycobacterium lepraemurium]